jgi:Plasmid maintenance system killer protein
MIKSFVHKGLEEFFLTRSTRGIQAKHAARIDMILDLLDKASTVEDTDFPGSALHRLKGDMKHLWSVKVSGNWRITFRFESGDVYIVNYQDYH